MEGTRGDLPFRKSMRKPRIFPYAQYWRKERPPTMRNFEIRSESYAFRKRARLFAIRGTGGICTSDIPLVNYPPHFGRRYYAFSRGAWCSAPRKILKPNPNGAKNGVEICIWKFLTSIQERPAIGVTLDRYFRHMLWGGGHNRKKRVFFDVL